MGIFDILKKREKKSKQSEFSVNDEILNMLDPSIRPLIKFCNENGIQTFACCSGNLSEHSDEKDGSRLGYMAFKDSKEARALIANLFEFEDLSIAVDSAPREPYKYYDNTIDSETFAVYFENRQGQNMQSVYERVENSINLKKAPKNNLKLINSLIKKLSEQKDEFEYNVVFNSILDKKENSKCQVNIMDMYLLDDDKNVGDVKLLSEDISHIFRTTDDSSCIGRIYLPEAMGKNVLPALDLIKKQALSQRSRYTISRDEARKPYEEVYNEQEFEYLGYEEEYEISDNFEEELDKEFPKVSMDEVNKIFNSNDKRMKEDDDFVI